MHVEDASYKRRSAFSGDAPCLRLCLCKKRERADVGSSTHHHPDPTKSKTSRYMNIKKPTPCELFDIMRPNYTSLIPIDMHMRYLEEKRSLFVQLERLVHVETQEEYSMNDTRLSHLLCSPMVPPKGPNLLSLLTNSSVRVPSAQFCLRQLLLPTILLRARDADGAPKASVSRIPFIEMVDFGHRMCGYI